jgi:hypothetical protein
MRAKILAATALSAGVLSVVGASVPAGAAPGSYPPGGKHHAEFSQSSYHRGNKAHFITGKAFRSTEKVLAVLRCNHRRYHHTEGPWRAVNHRVNKSFILRSDTPKTFCTLYLTGEKSGANAAGGFRVH